MSLFKKVAKVISNVVSPITDLVGDTINSVTGVNSQMDKSFEQQQEAMDKQNAYNLYMWELANEYNSPESQLARMADAGIDINPTSYALGTGNLSNTAGTVSSANGFSGSGSPAGNPISMAMGVASGIQGIREAKARTALTDENRINAMIAGNNMITQGTHTKLENDIMRHNLAYAQDHHRPVNVAPGIADNFYGIGEKIGNEIFNWSH